MYISSNDLKIYNLILVVFSSIDDSFSCVMWQTVSEVCLQSLAKGGKFS